MLARCARIQRNALASPEYLMEVQVLKFSASPGNSIILDGSR